jgi:exopolyphosphatase / guanosine-5'-triphosphate,3'-diphosphate pyrophosphatase
MKERVGVIDLGTNTFHLLIAEVGEGSMSIIHRERQPVKIGMGGINQGVIRDEAVARAIHCLQQFKKILDAERVSRILALGTSALRSADNGKDVIKAIYDATNITVKVISGDQEAEYIYHGIRAAMALGRNRSLIVDIGGGSVEFIIADRSQIFWKISLDIGAQRMLEKFHRHDPILLREQQSLYDFYEVALSPVAAAISEWMPEILIGSSGTFDTLSEIHCIRNGISYAEGKSESPLSLESFRTIHEEIITRNREQRLQIPGMIPMRVDMIVVASCLIEYLVDTFNFREIRVSSFSLKEGALATLVKT